MNELEQQLAQLSPLIDRIAFEKRGRYNHFGMSIYWKKDAGLGSGSRWLLEKDRHIDFDSMKYLVERGIVLAQERMLK